MRGSGSLAAGSDHLVERLSLNEMRVELLAKFAAPAGARIETFHYLWINVFHEVLSWEPRVAGS